MLRAGGWDSGCLSSPVPHHIPAPMARMLPVPEGLTLTLPAVIGRVAGIGQRETQQSIATACYGAGPNALTGAGLQPITAAALLGSPVCHLQSLSTRTGQGGTSPAMSALGLATPIPGAGTRPCLGCLCRHEEERVLSQLQRYV